MSKSYTHLFFDLDGTVTPSRSLIEQDMKEAMDALLESGRDVIIVSGAEVQQALYQTDGMSFVYLGQNGNHAYDKKNEVELWRELLTPEEKKEVLAHITSIPRTWSVPNESDLVEDRNSQIAYSLLGHHADKKLKSAFDPHGDLRKSLLEKFPFESNTMEVVFGGTTCLDYIKKGFNKGRNVSRLIADRAWNKDECIYFGDALHAGGNDASVVGVIETVAVTSPSETAAHIRSIMG